MVLVIVSASLLSLPLSPNISGCVRLSWPLSLCLRSIVSSIGGCAPSICLAALLARSFWSSQPHFGSSLIEFISQSKFWCPCSPNICLRFFLWCLPNGPLALVHSSGIGKFSSAHVFVAPMACFCTCLLIATFNPNFTVLASLCLSFAWFFRMIVFHLWHIVFGVYTAARIIRIGRLIICHKFETFR